MSEETAVVEPAVETVVESNDSTLLGAAKEEGVEAKPVEIKAEVNPSETKDVKIPEKYELKVPDGMTLDSALVDKLSPVFKKLGLSNEAVQELAETYAPHIKSLVEQQRNDSIEYFRAEVEKWKEETQKYLGANAIKELSYAAKLINRMSDTPEEAKKLQEFFNETGVGNFLPLNKILIKAGKLISEDRFVEAKENTQPGRDTITGMNTDVLYPTMKEK